MTFLPCLFSGAGYQFDAIVVGHLFQFSIQILVPFSFLFVCGCVLAHMYGLVCVVEKLKRSMILYYFFYFVSLYLLLLFDQLTDCSDPQATFCCVSLFPIEPTTFFGVTFAIFWFP